MARRVWITAEQDMLLALLAKRLGVSVSEAARRILSVVSTGMTAADLKDAGVPDDTEG